MKAITIALTFILIAFSSFAASPKASVKAKNPTRGLPGPSLNIVSLDVAPLIYSGLGASYDRVIKPNFTVGAFASKFQRSLSAADVDFLNLGGKGRYFFKSVNESSLYIGGAALITNLKATSKKGPSADSQGFGLQAHAGYQWIPASMKNTVLQVGVVGGHGTEADTVISKDEKKLTVDPIVSGTLEASIGLKF